LGRVPYLGSGEASAAAANLWLIPMDVFGMRTLRQAERTRRGGASISTGQILRGWPT
jgi:hypothetical protein